MLWISLTGVRRVPLRSGWQDPIIDSRPSSFENEMSGIVTLPLRTPFAVGPVNCHLLLGRPLALVDTGPRTVDALRDLEAGLAAHGHTIEDIELVLLTHQHSDHIGLAGTIKRRAGCQIAAHHVLAELTAGLADEVARETAFQSEVMSLHGVPGELVARFRAMTAANTRYAEPVLVDVALDDESTISAGGTSWGVARRPGHSPTDTVFVNTERPLALVGDHLLAHISSNPVLHRPLVTTPDPHRRWSSMLAYRASLRATATDALTLALTGHGNAIDDPGALITRRLVDQDARADKVHEALAAGPRTAFEIAVALWGETVRQQLLFTISEALGTCDLLAANGRVAEVTSESGIRYGAV